MPTFCACVEMVAAASKKVNNILAIKIILRG
jgi:hypothetical protein